MHAKAQLNQVNRRNPKTDSTFIRLFKKVIQGDLPVYLARVPMSSLKPFDSSFHLQISSQLEESINELSEHFKSLSGPIAWVYLAEQSYVLSDDYLLYEVAQMAKIATLPCYVMGVPSATSAEIIRGPLSRMEVDEAIHVIIA